ncbi:MAG: GAF domain-containing protein, partial [Pseudomonadota bacterium]
AARSRIAASWRRSFEHHGLDPTKRREKHVETDGELRQRRQKSEFLLRVATARLDHLFGLVGSSGCTVVLTDAEGFVLDQRSSNADARDFTDWGLLPGANWSEKDEGTNGIGTCLAEGRRVIVHRDQHFFPKNIAMSCIGAPIYGASGELIGVLDVSSARLDQTEGLNNLIAATVAETAKQIETENFRASFSHERVVIAGDALVDQSALVAVNSDDCIVGATRAARKLFGWGCDGALKPVAATDLFVEDAEMRGFNRAEKAAVVKALTRAGGNVSEAAKALGIGRATLYRRMKRLGLNREV